MENNTEISKKQFLSFSSKADNGNTFLFSDFLTLFEQSLIFELHIKNVSLFGGSETCERKIAKFGSADQNGYDIPYPIVCLEVSAKSEKFSDALSHRDFLGAIMNLGIDRDTVGDIFIINNKGYIFALQRVSDFICNNLFTISHTAVNCNICESIPDKLSVTKTPVKVNVASERADAIVGAIFHLSRSNSDSLFSAQKVYVNGKLFENGSKSLSLDDNVSVRGFGKFIYNGVEKETKKGRMFINADLFSSK